MFAYGVGEDECAGEVGIVEEELGSVRCGLCELRESSTLQLRRHLP